MDRQFLVEQLAERLRESAAVALQAQKAAADDARDGATAADKREDARVSQEPSSLARGRVGDSVEVVAPGETRERTIRFVG